MRQSTATKGKLTKNEDALSLSTIITIGLRKNGIISSGYKQSRDEYKSSGPDPSEPRGESLEGPLDPIDDDLSRVSSSLLLSFKPPCEYGRYFESAKMFVSKRQ